MALHCFSSPVNTLSRWWGARYLREYIREFRNLLKPPLEFYLTVCRMYASAGAFEGVAFSFGRALFCLPPPFPFVSPFPSPLVF